MLGSTHLSRRRALSDTRRTFSMDFLKAAVMFVQDYTFLTFRALRNLFARPVYVGDIIQQSDYIGFRSLPIVLAACFFTGASLALNSESTLARFGAGSLVGQLVSIGIVRELGPVLTALVMAGRNASGIASELGSMAVTEQIDAMRALGTDPIKKLVVPRLISTTVMIFFLTILGDFLGLVGGSVVAAGLQGISFSQYWASVVQALVYSDIVVGLTKPLVFGFIIATVGSFYGLSTKGGTQGVGRSTTQAVVFSMVLVIGVDVVVTKVLMTIFEL
jgi:phospholipid/cholesterol/gamma-HCH transport system permease protein